MDIEQILAGLRQNQAFQNGAWEQVVNTARKYAQVKCFGTITRDGSTHSLDAMNREWYERHFLEELVNEVLRAYREDATMGAAIQQAIQK